MAEVHGYQKILLSIVSTAVGILLLHQAYSEQDEIFILIYWGLGLVAMGAGLYVLLYRPRERKTVEAVQEASLPHECPSCGAPISSAGKFCGSCGAPLTVQEVTEE